MLLNARTWWTLLAIGVFSACAAPEPPAPAAFTYQLVRPVETLDPIAATAPGEPGVVDRLFDGLMRLDRIDKRPVPDLAASPRILEGGLIYEFELAPGARFHHGRSIQASDFTRSWQRLLDPANDSPLAWLLEPIAGAAAYRRGEATTISGIEVEGPRRLKIHLERPLETFLYHLAHPATSVVPFEEVERLGPRFARQPVGSGPYRFVSWSDDGNELRLEAVDGHPRQRSQATPLIYEVLPPPIALRLYQAGDLDLLSQLPYDSLRLIRTAYPGDLRIFPGREWIGFCFHCGDPAFSDRRVRRALALAVDREVLVHKIGAELRSPAIGFLPQVVPGYDPALLRDDFDLDHARALLAEAGYAGGQGVPLLILEEFYPTLLAQFLADSFRQLGLTAEVRNSNLGGPARGPIFLGIGAGEFPDPEPYLRSRFHSRGGKNLMSYENPRVDELLDTARHEQDTDRRRQLYRQVERLILEDAPCVVLYHYSQAVLVSSKWSDIPIGYDPNFFEIERARRRP